MTDDDLTDAISRVNRVVQEARGLVEEFFDPNGLFDAALVHQVPRNERCEITLEDLYAITFLDVSVPPRATRRLLYPANEEQSRQRQELSTLLAAIPADRDIWDRGVDLSDDGAAARLWKELTGLVGQNAPVTAGKLLARKRPRLIPIVDSVVVNEVGEIGKGRYWEFFRAYLSDEARRDAVERLRPSTAVEGLVSTLRLLDVAIWMTGSDGIAAVAARQRVGNFRRGRSCASCGVSIATLFRQRKVKCDRCAAAGAP